MNLGREIFCFMLRQLYDTGSILGQFYSISSAYFVLLLSGTIQMSLVIPNYSYKYTNMIKLLKQKKLA